MSSSSSGGSPAPRRLHLPRPPGRTGAGSPAPRPATALGGSASLPPGSAGKTSRFPLPPPSPSPRSRIRYYSTPPKQPSQLQGPPSLNDDDDRAATNRAAAAASPPPPHDGARGTPPQPHETTATAATTQNQDASSAPARTEDGRAAAAATRSTAAAPSPSPTTQQQQWQQQQQDGAARAAAPLPPGWIALALNDGTPYYYRAADQTTRWTRPGEEDGGEPEAPTAAGGEAPSPATAAGEETTATTATTTEQQPPPPPAPLPPGWVELVTNDGTPYFFRASDHAAQWTRPTETAAAAETAAEEETLVNEEEEEESDGAATNDQAAAAAAAADEQDEKEASSAAAAAAAVANPISFLPPGWIELQTQDGTPYFYNETSQATQWTRPEATGAAAAVAAADAADADADESLVVDENVVVDADSGLVDKDAGRRTTRDDSPPRDDSQQQEEMDTPPAEGLVAKEEEQEMAAVPPSPIAGTAAGGLPPGWIEAETEDGTPYFYNELNQVTQWTRPGMEGEEEGLASAEGTVVPNDASTLQAAADTAGVVVDDQADPAVAVPSTATDDGGGGVDDSGAHGAGDGDYNAVIEEEEEPQETPLPPGWIEVVTDDGMPYYYNELDQITQWTRPELPLENSDDKKDDELSNGAPEPSDHKNEIRDKESPMEQLPEGWIQQETEDGTPFYSFEADGTTQWERPGLLPEASTDAVVENNQLEMLPPAESEEPRPLEEPEEPAAAAVEHTTEGVLSTEEDSETLPPGWTVLQTEDGTPYYFHAADNRTTWERPAAEADNAPEDYAADSAFVVAEDSAKPAENSAPEMETEPVALDDADAEPEEAATMERQLPDGWAQLETDDGVPYFMFEADGSTQWHFPVFVHESAAADSLDDEDAGRPTTQEEPLQYDSEQEEEEEEEIAVPPVEESTAEGEGDTEVPVAGGGLPAGWVEAETEDGTPYFYHEVNQITQWTRPGEEEDKAVSPSLLEKEPSSLSSVGAVAAANEPTLQPAVDAGEGGIADDQAVPVPSTATEVDGGDGDVVNIEEEREREEVPLPQGWIEAVTDDGTVYYYHELDQITQWTRPELPLANSDEQIDASNDATEPTNDNVEISGADKKSPLAQKAELPDGWIQLESDDGTPYYMYEPDGTRQWESPVAAVVAGPEERAEDEVKTLAAGKHRNEGEQEQGESVEPLDPSVPLPRGWVRHATDDGTPYYMSLIDGATQWEAPEATEASNFVKGDTAAVAAVKEDDAFPPETDKDSMFAADGEVANVAELESSLGDTKELLEAAKESISLPDGWVQLVSADGTPYYMHEIDGSTQWEPPNSIGPREPHTMESIPEAVNQADETNDESAAATDEDLPAGWEAIVDENSGLTYYLFEDGTTTWEHPGSTAVGDAPVKPAAAPENTESPSFAAEGEAIDSSYVMVDDEAENDELPPGWIKIVDDNSGLPYYLNEEDGTSQWDPPAFDNTPEAQDVGQVNENDSAWEEEHLVSAPEDTGHEQEQSLPRGWSEQVDPDSGRSYFVEEATGSTSWERPIVPNTETVKRPPSSEGMRKAGRPAHTIASFGFGGRLCLLRNQGPKANVAAVHRTCNVAPDERVPQIEYTKRRFGIVGPLNSGKEELVKSYIDEKEASRDDLLWRLISIASMFQGRLRSSDSASSAGSPEAAIVDLLLEDNDLSSSNASTECSSEMVGSNHSSVLAVEKRLLLGEQEKAVEEAISSKNFALALLIASRCSQEHFQRTARCFADEALTSGQPLHTIALLFGGSYDPSSWEKVEPAILLEKWRSNVAAVLNNRVDGWRQTILDLGDRLLDLGDVIAAHVCFLACGCAITNPVSHDPRLVLLGCNLNSQDLVLGSASSVEAFERTEAYEWAKRRGNPKACFTSLQAFKVMYAVLLADFGLVDAAKAYINSILDCMESSLEDARGANLVHGRLSLSIMTANQEGLLATLGNLYDRLSCVTTTSPFKFDASLNDDDDAPSVRTAENVADSSFVTAKTNIEDDVSSPSPKSPPRSKPSGSGGESQPLQPIGEDNVQPGLESKIPPQPSLSSTENDGTAKGHQKPPPLKTEFHTAELASSQTTETPRQNHDRVKHQSAPMSAPANLENAKKQTPARTPSSGGFSSIKSWWTKKMNPEATQADLGEEMQAYYDKKKEVWVFPGEDPAEVAAPLPPPPKTPSEAAPAPEEPQRNNESLSPLAAMMAPPKRNPTAVRTRAGVRPSPKSMPPMFSPGMMSPTPNGGGGASAAPRVAVFQPKPSDGDVKKENEEPEEHE